MRGPRADSVIMIVVGAVAATGLLASAPGNDTARGATRAGSDCPGPGASVTASVSTPAPQETAGMGSPWVDGSAVQQAVARVGKLAASSRYGKYYTGVEIDMETQRVDVYRIPSETFDAALCEGVPGKVRLRLHDTTASSKQIDALAKRITDDWHRWDGEFDLRSVAPDERGHVVCRVDDPKAAEPLLRKAYGALVKVEHAEQVQAG